MRFFFHESKKRIKIWAALCFCVPRAKCANQLRDYYTMCNLSRLTNTEKNEKINMNKNAKLFNEAGIFLDVMTLRSNYSQGDMLWGFWWAKNTNFNLKAKQQEDADLERKKLRKEREILMTEKNFNKNTILNLIRWLSKTCQCLNINHVYVFP